MDVGAPELIIVLLIVLLIFGSTKLPKLARSMGQAAHEFRKGVSGAGDDAEASADPPAEPADRPTDPPAEPADRPTEPPAEPPA